MKKIIYTIFIVAFLLAPAGLLAIDSQSSPKQFRPIDITILKYKTDGYKVVVGPIQYLGKSDSQINLYGHKSVSFKRLDVVDETGAAWFVKKLDFVYILLKDSHVVLIRIKRKGVNNV